MSIRLCRECCQWVWTSDGRCPDCQDALTETHRPEQLVSRFQTLVGTVHGRIGHVRIPRRRLPSDGVLYATEHGLFFLPHRQVTRTRLVESPGSSPLWAVAAALWSPLIVLLPFLKRGRLKQEEFHENEPVRLSNDELHLLPELLARHPGSLFIARNSVRSVRQRRRRWVIQRTPGSSVTIEPVESIAFAERMNRLLKADAWSFLADYS